MKVRMKTKIAGSRNGVRWPEAGAEVDLPDGEGADLCAAGLAEPVVAIDKPAKATGKTPEKRG
jgi:hypothetical protein